MDLKTLKKEVDLLLASGVNPDIKVTRLVIGKPVEISSLSRKDVDCIVEENTDIVNYNKKQEVLVLK